MPGADCTVVMDNEGHDWLSKAILTRAHYRSPQQKLFGETSKVLRERLTAAAKKFGLHNEKVTLYQLLRGEPPSDFLAGLHSLQKLAFEHPGLIGNLRHGR